MPYLFIKFNQSSSEIKRIKVCICVDRGATIWHCGEAKTCTSTVELQAGSFDECQALKNNVEQYLLAQPSTHITCRSTGTVCVFVCFVQYDFAVTSHPLLELARG